LAFFVSWQPVLDGNGLWFDLMLTPFILIAFYRQSPALLSVAFFFKQTTLWLFPLFFKQWKKVPFSEKKQLMKKVASILLKDKEKLARTITLEMGKTIRESLMEVEKCATVCNFFAEQSENILKKEIIKTDAKESYVRFDPIGIIFAIMPWNFPFWQVFRAAAQASGIQPKVACGLDLLIVFSAISLVVTIAPIAAAPLTIALAKVTMSGVIFSISIPNNFPQRENPFA